MSAADSNNTPTATGVTKMLEIAGQIGCSFVLLISRYLFRFGSTGTALLDAAVRVKIIFKKF